MTRRGRVPSSAASVPLLSNVPSGVHDGAAAAGSVGRHLPVMLHEVLEALAPRAGEVLLDGTFGGGGYSAAILDAAPGCTVWAIDRDPEAIARGAAIAARYPGRLHLVHGRFGDMLALLRDRGASALHGVVLDLGVSSFQLDDPARGFSFRSDGPLDMRMSASSAGPTASDLINSLPEEEIADILFHLGEERLARRVARAIVRARASAPITTTAQLADVVRGAVPRERSGGIDPATRSFQALRIRVNDELGEIERALAGAAELLAPAGRLVVVSFHSLEDRLVKRFMADASGRVPAPSRHDPGALLQRQAAPRFRLAHAGARRPSEAEARRNPRSRSARLRTLVRLPSPGSDGGDPTQAINPAPQGHAGTRAA